MAPVEFTVSGGEGSPLEHIAALVPRVSLVVVTDPGGWAQVSRGLTVGGTICAAIPTRMRVLRFAVLDLRHFPSAAALPSISDVPGDVVALHDTRTWDSSPVVAALRGLGRPVVLFTAVHTWVSGLDPASVLMGWSTPHVVLAAPVTRGEGRVEDVLWQFRELERRGMVRYTPLPQPPAPDDRAVAVVVAPPGATQGVAGALRPGAEYEVWVHVGPHAARLPADVELRAVLCMSGRDVQAEPFVLPAEGASPWVSFPVTTPYAAARWSGFLVIYAGAVPVHAQQVVLPVGAGEVKTTPRFRLSRTFADLPPWTTRVASLLVLGPGALVATGGAAPSWIPLDAGYRRSVLNPSVLNPSGLDPWYGKDFPAYCADLAALAREGAALYSRLFADRALPELIRAAARSTGRPAGVVVAGADFDPVPWPLVYDLPFAEGPYRLCASVGHFGPFGAGGEVPAHCPVPDHGGNVVCPFGFWGLSTVLEQPVGPVVWQVSDRPRPFEVSMAVDPGMDRTLTERHAAELMSMVPPEAVSSAYVSPSELGHALADEAMDVVHLHFREGFLDAEEIERWEREGVWPRPHWPTRKPLVVATSPVQELVRAFVRHGAAGVLSPEVAVPQDMAGWVTGMVLARLAAGFGAGEALRQTRWEMLGRGNVLGLAYTLNASADLRLRR
ncbi:hypothetical protein [Nocardia sp. NRRL S-836]|uniref:hypothetical protein n=1 Tax=Nocardia sp. NRRL S-836 TaxID=1519492 RepID=UPI0006AE5945|nr:hypothetical protein [Nocardia sp. NRRL S-836]KOV79279.1 hypothetical protein ADL03_37400 [Nocardia sp. NRRL S-836]